MKYVTVLLLTLQAAFMQAQTQVSSYRAGLSEEGITYFLPTTGCYITMTATRTVYTPGEYARYAERYLRLRDISLQGSENWVLTDVKLTPFGQADSAQVYSIRLNNKTSAPLVSLAPDGRLLSVNAVADTLPAAPSAFIRKQLPPQGVQGLISDYKTRDVLTAGSTAKMAELAAAEIYDLRENRALLAKGQADFMPKDGEQLRLMFESLDKQEQALLALFKGTEHREQITVTIPYVPRGEMANEVFYRFSRHLGFVEADNPVGAPLYISVTDLHSLPAAVETTTETRKAIERRERSLRYLLPGQGRIRIHTFDKEWANVTLPMAQFGRVEYLGNELFNKCNTTHLYLSPIHGGILHIERDVQ